MLLALSEPESINRVGAQVGTLMQLSVPTLIVADVYVMLLVALLMFLA